MTELKAHEVPGLAGEAAVLPTGVVAFAMHEKDVRHSDLDMAWRFPLNV